jgi:hypothetical protein
MTVYCVCLSLIRINTELKVFCWFQFKAGQATPVRKDTDISPCYNEFQMLVYCVCCRMQQEGELCSGSCGLGLTGSVQCIGARSKVVGEPVRLVLLGHSYVRRLSEAMELDGTLANLGLPRDKVYVRCVSLGGATLREGSKCIRQLLHEVIVHHPSVVYVHVGDNDVRDLTSNNICRLLLDLVDRLKSVREVKFIVVGRLLAFPVFSKGDRKLAAAVNDELNMALKHQSAVCDWYHRGGFWKPMGGSLFDGHGVHLNADGMRKYWRSVQGAIRTGLKVLE